MPTNDPVISFLDTNLREVHACVHKKIHTRMFTAVYSQQPKTGNRMSINIRMRQSVDFFFSHLEILYVNLEKSKN